MDRNTGQIALACGIGAGVFCLSTLLVVPHLWWLGAIIGFPAGYLSYEFRETLRAIPKAWKTTNRLIGSTALTLRTSFANWFKGCHPFAYAYVVLFVILCVSLLTVHPEWVFTVSLKNPSTLEDIIAASFLSAIYTIPITFIFVFVLAFLGASIKSCYWSPSKILEDGKKHGWREVPLTYRNIFYFVLIGYRTVLLSPLFLAWYLVRYTVIFSWTFVKLIHSQKRVLCGIDGVIGGMVARFLFVVPDMSFGEQALYVLAGIIFGAVFGVLNWEIVSKRVLKVAPSVNHRG